MKNHHHERPVEARQHRSWITVTLLASALLAGCDLRQRLHSPEDRINAAVPPGIDIRQARERLGEQLASIPADRTTLDNAWQGRLRARATSCSPDFTPSWRHSDDEVRAAVGNKACFAEYDRKLARWIGAQRVRLLLAQPAAPVGSLPPSTTVQGQLADASVGSSVAAVTSGDGLELVALEGGRSLFKERGSGGSVSVSPNGRLFVQVVSGVARVRAVEGGETLLELPDASQVQWLGDWFIGVRSANHGKPPYLFSLNSAEETPVVVNTYGAHSNEALLPVPGDGNRFNLLTFTGLYQLEAQESGGKLSVSAVAEKSGVQQRLMGITFNRGQLSADGRSWVLASSGVLVRMDLTTLQVQETSFEPLHIDHAVPTGKPDQFVLQFRSLPGDVDTGQRRRYVYDAAAGTLARVAGEEAQRPLRYLHGIGRLARISSPTVWFVDTLALEAPEPVKDVVTAALDEVNQAKLNELQREQQHIAQSPALQPGSALLPVVRDAQVEGIGIYEAREKTALPGQPRGAGRVAVNVRRSSRPLVLVLTSYEPVQWQLRLEPGARLGAVLLGSYGDSGVQGAGDARVLRIGQHYAYEQSGAKFAGLQREVSRWAGRPITLFQSGYYGTQFTVGGS